MTGSSARVEIRPLEVGDLDAASRLLAARHTEHRRLTPALDASFESPANARTEIEALWTRDDASAWAAQRGGAVVGYLIGLSKEEALWGSNVWVEAAGHAVTEPSIVRDLYAAAAAGWVAEGRLNHHVLVPAPDEALVDAWFSLDFGQQHLHAVREPPPAGFGVVPRSELVVRRAVRADVPVLAELEQVLPRHSAHSPVFSTVPIPALEQIRAEWDRDFEDPRYTTFVAEHGGRVVGSAIGCSLEVSSGHMPLTRPKGAGFLGFAAVLADARGLGAGRALAEAVLAWIRDAGYDWAVTDWRSTNLEADRTWRTLGFRPTFRRLHRSIII